MFSSVPQKIHICYFKTLILTLCICIIGFSNKSIAQNYKANDYLVLYATGWNSFKKTEVKYLLISKHNIKLAEYVSQSHGFESFKVGVTSQFHDFIDNIDQGEIFSAYLSEKVPLNTASVEVTESALNILTNHNLFQEYEHIKRGEPNRQSATIQVRENIIRYYREKGYVIRQVDFKPNTHLDEHSYMNGMKIENVDPLSSWEVANFEKGEIKRAGEWALKMAQEEREMEAAISRIETERMINSTLDKRNLISEYEYIKKAGNSGAVSQEESAKKLIVKCENYEKKYGKDDEISRIIAEAKQWTKSGKAEALTNLTVEAGSALAEDIFTPYTIYGVGYTGLTFKESTFDTRNFQKITFQLSGVRKFMNIIGEVGYFQSPSYVYKTEDYKSSTRTWITVSQDTARLSGAYLGFGFGPSIRLFKNHVIIHGLAQFATTIFKDQTWMGGVDVLGYANFSGGVIFRAGSLGLGASYNLMPFMKKWEAGETLKSEDYNTNKGRVTMVTPFDSKWSGIEIKLMFNFSREKIQ